MAKQLCAFEPDRKRVDKTLFIDTSLQTRFGMRVSDADSISDIKNKIQYEHQLCFPNVGKIKVEAIKVKRRGHFYRLSDYFLLCEVFEDLYQKSWFLYVDAVALQHDVQTHHFVLPDSSVKNTSVVVVSHPSRDHPSSLSNLDKGAEPSTYDHDQIALVTSSPEKQGYSGMDYELPSEGTRCEVDDSGRRMNDVQLETGHDLMITENPIDDVHGEFPNEKRCDKTLRTESQKFNDAFENVGHSKQQVECRNDEFKNNIGVQNEEGLKQVSNSPLAMKKKQKMKKRKETSSKDNMLLNHDSEKAILQREIICVPSSVQVSNDACNVLQVSEPVDNETKNSKNILQVDYLNPLEESTESRFANEKHTSEEKKANEKTLMKEASKFGESNKDAAEASLEAFANDKKNVGGADADAISTQNHESGSIPTDLRGQKRKKRKKMETLADQDQADNVPYSGKDAKGGKVQGQDFQGEITEINEYSTGNPPTEIFQISKSSALDATRESVAGNNSINKDALSLKSTSDNLGVVEENHHVKPNKQREEVGASADEKNIIIQYQDVGISNHNGAREGEIVAQKQDSKSILSEIVKLSGDDDLNARIEGLSPSSKDSDRNMTVEPKTSERRRKKKKLHNPSGPLVGKFEGCASKSKDVLTEFGNLGDFDHSSKSGEEVRDIFPGSQEQNVTGREVLPAKEREIVSQNQRGNVNEKDGGDLEELSEAQEILANEDKKKKKKSKRHRSSESNIPDEISHSVPGHQQDEVTASVDVLADMVDGTEVARTDQRTESNYQKFGGTGEDSHAVNISTKNFEGSASRDDYDGLTTQFDKISEVQGIAKGGLSSSKSKTGEQILPASDEVKDASNEKDDGNLKPSKGHTDADNNDKKKKKKSKRHPSSELKITVTPAKEQGFGPDTPADQHRSLVGVGVNHNATKTANADEADDQVKPSSGVDMIDHLVPSHQQEEAASLDGETGNNRQKVERNRKGHQAENLSAKQFDGLGTKDECVGLRPRSEKMSQVRSTGKTGISPSKSETIAGNDIRSYASQAPQPKMDQKVEAFRVLHYNLKASNKFSRKMKRQNHQLNMDKLSPVKNPSGSAVGLNHEGKKRSLLAPSVPIFKDDSSGSLEDEDQFYDSNASTRTPSDNSLSSGYSDGESNADSQIGKDRENGERLSRADSWLDKKAMTIENVLRSSKRYKKTKLIASQETESQPPEFVPDSQANL